MGTIQTTVFAQSLPNFTCKLWMVRGGTLLIWGQRSRSTLCIKPCGHAKRYSFLDHGLNFVINFGCEGMTRFVFSNLLQNLTFEQNIKCFIEQLQWMRNIIRGILLLRTPGSVQFVLAYVLINMVNGLVTGH